MAQPYVGEIRMFAGNFAPAGWMFCEGQLLPISENETLFQLIGTTYGGDGQSTFALPDLRGRIPIAPGQRLHPRRDGRRRGDHAHGAADPGAHPSAAGLWRPRDHQCAGQQRLRHEHRIDDLPLRHRPAADDANSGTIGPVGGSQPHTNFQPYLCVDFIISLFGIFPSPT